MFVLYEAMQKTRDFDNKHALFCDTGEVKK